MYVSRLFVWGHEPETGFDGWMLQRPANNMRGYEPVPYPFTPSNDGRSLVHDVMEHFTPPSGTNDFANELMAIGQALWIRIENGDWVRKGFNRSANIGSLIYDAWIDSDRTDEGADLPRCPIDLVRQVREDYLNEIRIPVRSELERLLQGEDADPDHIQEAVDSIPRMIDWMNYGYFKARRRWFDTRPVAQGHNVFSAQCEANELFWSIAREIDAYHSLAEPGEQMRVAFNIRRFTFAISRRDPAIW